MSKPNDNPNPQQQPNNPKPGQPGQQQQGNPKPGQGGQQGGQPERQR